MAAMKNNIQQFLVEPADQVKREPKRRLEIVHALRSYQFLGRLARSLPSFRPNL
jgi:hypothetical protein